MAKRLTALAVSNLKPRAARYELPDGSSSSLVWSSRQVHGAGACASGGRTSGRQS